MVRTRGLGHALGYVTGRGVGRGDRDDYDDAPQRRRPTTSARRQRVPVTAAHDEPVLPAPDVEADVFSDDPMAPADVEDTRADIPANTGTQAAEDEHEGFPGGPSDPSVLTQYTDIVACNVWTGEVFMIFIFSYLLIILMIEISFPLNDDFNEFCIPLYFNSGAS